MHTSQPEPVMTSFRSSKSDPDEADDSTHKVREVLSDYETLLGMMPEEMNAAEEDANGGLSMFDIAEQSSNS